MTCKWDRMHHTTTSWEKPTWNQCYFSN